MIEELMDYYPYGDIRFDEKAGTFNEQRKYAGQEFDADTGLSYMNARYYNGKIGRFISQDPAYLAVGNENQLKQITGLKLYQYLSDPQAFNSYAYARNNPLIYIDQDGRFFGQFGIDMSNNQRGVANAFHGLGNYFRSQGYIGYGAGFASDTIGDVANNVANIWDPRESGGSKMFAVGMATLDVGSGGKGSSAGKVVSMLNKAHETILNSEERQIIKEAIQSPTLRNIFSSLYKGSDKLPGGTAGAISYEQATGNLLSKTGHMYKGQTTMNGLNKILQNPNVGQSDKSIAKTLFNQLNHAIKGK